MLPVRLGDLFAAARVLLDVPSPRRAWVARRMLAEAERAAHHAARRGRPHPRFGDGSLMAAALRRHPVQAPALSDARFRAALRAVLDALDTGYTSTEAPGAAQEGGQSHGP